MVEGRRVLFNINYGFGKSKAYMLAPKAWKIFSIMPKFKNMPLAIKYHRYMRVLAFQHACTQNFHNRIFIEIREGNAEAETLDSRVASKISIEREDRISL